MSHKKAKKVRKYRTDWLLKFRDIDMSGDRPTRRRRIREELKGFKL